MTREELVLALEAIATLASMNLPGIDEADDVIAAIENLRQRVRRDPPCACEGGKLIADNLEMVYSPHDERHWLEVGMLLERERAGENVRVRIVEVKENPPRHGRHYSQTAC